MATETLALTAVSSPDEWTLGAGADKPAAVASPDDADTTYIHVTGFEVSRKQRMAVANPSAIGAGDTINSVTIVARCKHITFMTTYVVRCHLGGNSSDGATQNTSASYADTEDDFLTRPGGGAWTLADLQNFEVEIEEISGLAMRCTTWYASVDYTVSPSTFEGPNDPTDVVSTGTGIAWADPSNAETSDGASATFTDDGAGTTTSYLYATGFGFSIPAGATIDGLLLEIQRKRGHASMRAKDVLVQLIVGGVLSGANKADTGADWPDSFAYATYFGAGDTGGLSLTPDDVNAGAFLFGAVLRARDAASTGNIGSVDHIRMTVYYTAGGGAPTEGSEMIAARQIIAA